MGISIIAFQQSAFSSVPFLWRGVICSEIQFRQVAGDFERFQGKWMLQGLTPLGSAGNGSGSEAEVRPWPAQLARREGRQLWACVAPAVQPLIRAFKLFCGLVKKGERCFCRPESAAEQQVAAPAAIHSPAAQPHAAPSCPRFACCSSPAAQPPRRS